MAKRRSLSGDPCPMARSLEIVGDRWSLLIIRDAFDGMRRFGDFQQSLGVAKNILAQRLRRLVDAGVLELTPASDGSMYQEYVLTAMGRALFTVVIGLRQWGEAHLYGEAEPRSELVERVSGLPVRQLRPRTHAGRPLDPDATWVRKVAPPRRLPALPT